MRGWAEATQQSKTGRGLTPSVPSELLSLQQNWGRPYTASLVSHLGSSKDTGGFHGPLWGRWGC